MSLPKVERNPWTIAGRKPADNPYDRIMGSLRMAAMRRDAATAVSAEPAADEGGCGDPGGGRDDRFRRDHGGPDDHDERRHADGDDEYDRRHHHTAADTTVGGDTATGTETATGADTTTGGDTSTGRTTTTGGTTGHPKKKPGHL